MLPQKLFGFTDIYSDTQGDALKTNYLDDQGMPLMALHWEHRFKRMVKRYNEIFRVQIPTITPHVCRHTYCSNQAKSGMNPKTLQYLMGCCVPFGTR